MRNVFPLGHYVYFESSWPVKTGKQGIVESKIFGPTQATCMSFYFSMYGNTMGKLTVYIQDINKLPSQNNRRKVWEKIGNQGISWQNSRITISSSTRFTVMIAMSFGRGPLLTLLKFAMIKEHEAGFSQIISWK